MAIVDDVAEKEGVHPIELEPLQSTLDTDALETLCAEDTNQILCVEFRYHGYEVTVESDGQVDVDRR